MSQVAVRDKQYVLIWQIADNLYRVGGSHTYVGPGFDLRGGVDVADHGQILVLFPGSVDDRFVHHVRHRAVGGGVRHENGLLRIQKLGALSHEGDAAEHENRVRKLHRQLAQIKGVSDIIGNFLHLRRCIVMRQNNGVFFFF